MSNWVYTDDRGRVLGSNPNDMSGNSGWHGVTGPVPELLLSPEGVPRYKLADGEVIERTAAEISADVAAIPPPPPDPLVVTQKAATVMFRALAKADVITAADALDNALMFPVWADCIGQRAEAGSYWRHGDKLYRVNAGQGHTIQADWAHNAYAVGDKVTHDGKKWTSTADANTWEPGEYGWEEVK